MSPKLKAAVATLDDPPPARDTSPPPRDDRSGVRRLRLEYLDGIRGIVAVVVLLGHATVALRFFHPSVNIDESFPRALISWGVPAQVARVMLIGLEKLFGVPTVELFIVLSGYCLMLPVLPAGGHLPGGLISFVRRRALRILPPYYAMFAISLAIAAIMVRYQLCRITGSGLALRWDAVLSHLFLVHDARRDWAYAYNGPMWSVAVEWHIYFLFPLLLLPVWRRFGRLAMIGVAFVLGAPIHMPYRFYAGLFAFGMVAAELTASASPPTWTRRVPWGWATVVSWIAVIVTYSMKQASIPEVLPIFTVGVASMCLLVYATQSELAAAGPRNALLSVLTSKVAMKFGEFSYSIYLTHYPFMVLGFFLTLPIRMSIATRFALMFGVFVPFTIGFAYVFYLFVERPFVRYRPAKKS